MGAPLPTTCPPNPATIHEEGLHFPRVRVEQAYEIKADIIRIALTEIRASRIWHGDFQAQRGACRRESGRTRPGTTPCPASPAEIPPRPGLIEPPGAEGECAATAASVEQAAAAAAAKTEVS